MKKKLEFRLRRVIPLTSILIGCLFVGFGVLAFVFSEKMELIEIGIFGTSILVSGFWFIFGILGLRTIRIEEQVFKKYGNEGVEELRNTCQEFNWRKITKNIQPVAGADTTRWRS